MPLPLADQFELATGAITTGDIDLLTKTLTDPDSITTADQRSVAEKLGVKRGLLAAFTNIISDPTVWIAALMSRAFPTSAWLRGTIPQRYVGATNEFTGLSLLARPVEDFFRGTPIPRLVALRMRRETEVMKVGAQMFEKFNRPNWRQEMPIVSMLMEGQNPTGATPQLRAVADDIRKSMNDMWGFLKRAKKIEGGFTGESITQAKVAEFLPHEAPKFLRDYLPHIPLTADASVVEISGAEALRRMGRKGLSQAMAARGESMPWTVNQADRLASDYTRWQSFMGRVGMEKINPRMFKRQRHGIQLMSEQGHELFVTDLNTLLPRYVHSVARTFANNAPLNNWEKRLASSRVINDRTGAIETIEATNDPIMVQVINQGIRAAGGKKMQRQIAGTQKFEDVIIPGTPNAPTMTALQRLARTLQGTASDDEILFGNLFNAVGKKLDQYKTNISGKQMNEMDAALKQIERHSSYRKKTNGIASYLYATTLGLNPWSAMQNLMQPILTTMPTIGIGPTIAGYRVLKQRMPQYAREFIREHRRLGGNRQIGITTRTNAALESSFHKTFPELAEQGFKIDPRLFEVDEGLLTGPGGIIGARHLRGMDAFNKMLLQPFTHSELSNQVVSFFGAKNATRNAIRAGEYTLTKGELASLTPERLDDLLNLEAGLAVSASQFRPGPGSRTVAQHFLPAPFRMFTSFPIRLFNFFGHSTVRGAMTNQQLQSVRSMDILAGGEKGRLAQQKVLSLGTGRNLGTMARTFLYGRMATEGASQALDIDLGGALGLTGPFNLAPAGQPFAPLPLPPIASVTHGVLSAAINRDIKRMQPMHLPFVGEIPVPKSLFPGGVGVGRMIKAAQQFRPDLGGFVDEDERLMYRGDTTDLILAMLGVPLDKNRRSRDAMEKGQNVRTRVRKFRRQYAAAKASYDTETMFNLKRQFSEKFPDMPPLTVSDADVRKYEMNARIPAVQRFLNTMGRNARFLERDIYEHDPELLAPDFFPQQGF